MKYDIFLRFIEISDDFDSKLIEKSLRDIVFNFVIVGRDIIVIIFIWVIYMIMMNEYVVEKFCLEL